MRGRRRSTADRTRFRATSERSRSSGFERGQGRRTLSDNKEDHGLLRDSVAKFLGARYDIERRREIAASEAGWSRDIWREMAELGLLAAAIPAEAGGFAEGIEEALYVMEGFGSRLVVEPFSETAIVH